MSFEISLVLVRENNLWRMFSILTGFDPALKTITTELPVEGKMAARACEKLTPKLLSQLESVRVALQIVVQH